VNLYKPFKHLVTKLYVDIGYEQTSVANNYSLTSLWEHQEWNLWDYSWTNYCKDIDKFIHDPFLEEKQRDYFN